MLDRGAIVAHDGAMQLGGFVDRLRSEIGAAAEAAGGDAREVVERVVVSLDSAVRLTILEALSAATDEITRELAPGSVHLRMRGREADFVVMPPPAEAAPPVAPDLPDVDDGPVARINFRPPEALKSRIEQAASRDGLSVNAWLVRAAAAALDGDARRGPRSDARSARFTGWVG